MKNISFYAYLFCCCVIMATHLYSPKWAKTGSNATLSWDVSGYYMYLPCAFIYHDLKTEKGFRNEAITKYKATPNHAQAFKHEASGNYVMKYSMGQAIQYMPSFFVAHIWATLSNKYPADGFSFPYQICISIGSLLIAFLGLFYLRKNLLFYFSEEITSLGMIAIVVGTNYLNYAAIDGAMTHNGLFTIYSILIYNTIRFYKKPTYKNGLLIGLLVGLAALTRPTEIISCLIPVLWGLNFFDLDCLKNRLQVFKVHFTKMMLAIICCLAVGSLQLIYWKYVSGDWIVYSYQDQGFSWLSPHIIKAATDFECGWFIYTPLMMFGILGFIPLISGNKKLFFPTIIYSSLFIYIAFSWDIWCYGGSLGQRSVVQAYAILIFPLCAFLAWVLQLNRFVKIWFFALIALFCYVNVWFTYQAHGGGIFKASQMTNAYYWKTIGTYTINPENIKLLDTNELFEGERKNVRLVYENDFGTWDESSCCVEEKDDAEYFICLNKQNQQSSKYEFKVEKNFEWLRASVDAYANNKEWNHWQMTQLTVSFKRNGKSIHDKYIRLQRHLNIGDKKTLFIDVSKPNKAFDSVEVFFNHAGSRSKISLDNLQVEIFDER